MLPKRLCTESAATLSTALAFPTPLGPSPRDTRRTADCAPLSSFFRSAHGFSIGLRSGLLAGHDSACTPLLHKNEVTARLLWAGASSCRQDPLTQSTKGLQRIALGYLLECKPMASQHWQERFRQRASIIVYRTREVVHLTPIAAQNWTLGEQCDTTLGVANNETSGLAGGEKVAASAIVGKKWECTFSSPGNKNTWREEPRAGQGDGILDP